MLKTSFLDIMRVLTKEELKRFEAFLASPYFNTRSHVVKLFNAIKKYAPGFNNSSLDKEQLWEKIFPGKDYNYGIIKNIIHDITKLAEKFLEVEELNLNEMQRMKNLLNKLGERNLENIFFSKYNFFEKNFFKSSKFYNSFYGHFADLKISRFQVEGYNPKLHSKLIATDISLLLIFDFIAKFSNNFNNFYIEETELNEKPENDLIRQFAQVVFSNPELGKNIEKFSNGSNNDYKIINILFKLMKCYLNRNRIDLYYDFKKALFENDKYISESGMRGLYASLGSALDNCQDGSDFNKNRELYEIISHLIEKNIFLSDDGKMIPTLYLLSIKTAGYLKETLFIEKIINNYLPKLDEELKDSFKSFSLAYLNYSRNDYENAMEHSGKVNIDTFQLKYILRNLQIIISFEKYDYEMFQYLSDSHRHFLSNNKSVSESYKTSNMKFLNYTNTLFKLKESKNKSEAGFLENSLSSDLVVNKFWLLEKLKEIQI